MRRAGGVFQIQRTWIIRRRRCRAPGARRGGRPARARGATSPRSGRRRGRRSCGRRHAPGAAPGEPRRGSGRRGSAETSAVLVSIARMRRSGSAATIRLARARRLGERPSKRRWPVVGSIPATRLRSQGPETKAILAATMASPNSVSPRHRSIAEVHQGDGDEQERPELADPDQDRVGDLQQDVRRASPGSAGRDTRPARRGRTGGTPASG